MPAIYRHHKLTLYLLLFLLHACYSGDIKNRIIVYENQQKLTGYHTIFTPPPHVVKAKETLYSISNFYHVPLRELIETNKLSPPFVIKPGQTLIIPSQKTHRIQRGDTIYAIARKYNVSVNALVHVNSLKDPYILNINEILFLPSITKRVPATTYAKTSDDKKTTKTINKPIQPKTIDTKTTKVVPPPKSLQPKIFPAKRSSSKFLNPVNGKIIIAYGGSPQGQSSDGINIAAPQGTAVKSAENGIVVFSDDSIKALGNLVLIKHQDGFVTSYAHLQNIKVNNHDPVTRGQVIANVGTTGYVKRSQLNFKIFKHGKPVNPAAYVSP